MNDEIYNEKLKDLKRQYQEIEQLNRAFHEQQEIALTAIYQTLPDDVAVKVPLLYPDFDGLIGQTFKDPGCKFVYSGELYKTIQPNFTFQAHFPPGVGTESMYERIDEKHAGTAEDPIPFKYNMKLEDGKYYSEDGVTYYCYRDSGIPMTYKLSELVEQYVHVV